MRATCRILSILLAAALLWPATAGATARLALVIGNGAYQTAPLANPPNDMNLVADALEDSGFDVTRLQDGGRREMRDAIRAFSEDVAAAGRDAVALFYFAGHGVQLNGRNYLIPVGAELRSPADMEYEAVEAQWALDLIGESQAGISIIVLDACRNNPFRSVSRAASRGLAQMDAPRGSILAYSTAPGDVASDGDGGASPYSGALAAAIREPGLKIEDVFKRVRRQVLIDTSHEQTPWESSSLVGDFYFTGGGQTASLAAPSADEGADGPSEDEAGPGAEFGEAFQDCDDCPEMVAVPGGEFDMGSDAGETGHVAHEGPPTLVEVGPYALGLTEVTVGQFRAFVDETGHKPSSSAGCWHWALVWLWDAQRSWTWPGYEVSDAHPVACVNWHDARAYAEWLTEKTGERYRLPTEAEWEYAAGGGEDAAPWGDDIDAACEFANIYDQAAVEAFGAWFPTADCRDDHPAPAEAGAFPPNAFGLSDMFGSLQEWTGDCWNGGHQGRPSSGRSRQDGNCGVRVFKGGHFASDVKFNRPAFRIEGIADHPNAYSGFRVARDMD